MPRAKHLCGRMQAVHALLKMAKLRPEDPDIPKHLARLHHALGESHQAIKAGSLAGLCTGTYASQSAQHVLQRGGT